LYLDKMKEYKSVGFNPTLSLIWIGMFAFFLGLDDNDMNLSTFIIENLYYFITSLMLLILFSIDVVIANREGIIKKSYFFQFKIKSRTWKEIKHYAEVDEVYHGQYGKSNSEAIWFIDKNDKVCLRIGKGFRNNVDEVLEMVDKFEDKFENKLKISNPYFMKRGWTKVDYPKKQQHRNPKP